MVCVYSFTKSSHYVAKASVIVERVDEEYLIKFFEKEKISKSRIMIKLGLKWLRFCGGRIQIGEYTLRDNISLKEALTVLSSGNVVKHKICFPEGFSVAQVLHRLNENEFLLGEVEEIPEEGSLMPSTYTFKYPTTRQEIIEQAKKAMAEFIKEVWQNRPRSCEIKSPEDLLKLASIVEKERTKNDAAVIARIYLNRLKKGMRLQADPTTIYAIAHGKKLGRPLRYSDLMLKSPYNTYTKAGLPITPICNPGKEAVISVLYPQNHNYFFFAHDKDGRIYLSESFDEHKKKANMIRKNRKDDVYKKKEF